MHFILNRKIRDTVQMLLNYWLLHLPTMLILPKLSTFGLLMGMDGLKEKETMSCSSFSYFCVMHVT